VANDLVVQLGAKLDQFSKDMNQAGDIADQAVSDIESKFASLNPSIGGFASLGIAAASVTGAVTTLLTALAHVNSELADLQRNATFVGVTTDRFQRIQFAAGQGGVSSSDSVDDLRKVASLLADAKQNENSLTRLLDANNIKYKDRNGQVITLNQLLDIAGGLLNKFSSMPEKTKAAQMLGLSQGWVEALRNGSKSFEDIAAGADDAGAVIDRATVAKAAEFDRAWKASTAQLGAQFKSVTADIAIWLDGLIEKANELVAETLKAQGIQAGSGQDKFNSYADALDILRKDMQGAAQDADQVSRVIERMKSSGKGDPDIVAGLELIRAKAVLTAQQLRAVAEEQSKVNFPNGVPTPKSRPVSANNDDPNAAKLPDRKGGTKDAYDRATEAIAKHTARLEADSESVGKGAAAQEELRAQTQLFTAAQLAGIPITQKVKDQIQDLAQDAGEAADALAKAKVASDTDFGLKSAFLTPEDLSIAQQLKGIYGNDIPTALASTEAAGLQAAATLRQLGTLGQDVNRSFLVDFTTQIRNGASAMDALKTAGVNALGKIADKLVSMAADNLWASAFGGSTGGLGSFFGSLFGGGSSPTGVVGAAGGLSVPTFAGGTNYAPGGPSIIGENGPELLNIPRGAQIVPNDVLRNSGVGGGTTVSVGGSTVVVQGDASEKTLALIGQALAQHDAALPPKVVAAVLDAKKRRVLA
jgi:hypothetical protein